MAKEKILRRKVMNTKRLNYNFQKNRGIGRPEHKFFERYLDNDLEDLSNFLRKKYEELESGMYDKKAFERAQQHFLDSNSISTVKWREYNVFQFHHEGIFNVLKNLKDTLQEACEYYNINFDDQQYMVQGWFNINKSGKGKLNWHEHGPGGAPFFHGYYCVNAEPSITHYRIYNDPNMPKENININNRLVVSEMGHPHAQGDWEWEGDRITLAYDAIPLSALPKNAPEQHWIPLV